MAKCSQKGCKKGATLRTIVVGEGSTKTRPVCADCARDTMAPVIANNNTVNKDAVVYVMQESVKDYLRADIAKKLKESRYEEAWANAPKPL